MDSRKPPDSLSRVMESWRLNVPGDPRFRSEVRQRIDGARSLTWGGYLRLHAAAVGGLLVLALLVGAFGGRERARARTAADSARLATAYVEGLDARMMVMR